MDRTFKVGDKIVVGECDAEVRKCIETHREHREKHQGCKGKVLFFKKEICNKNIYKCEIILKDGSKQKISFSEDEIKKQQVEYTFNIKIK